MLNQLYFYLTEGCNLKCRHCWLAPKYDPKAKRYPVLPTALFEKAILEGKRLGLSGVKLTGGEPLMHPDIVRLLEIVRREQLALTIETNGQTCTHSLADEIAKSPHASVSVSLDSPDADTHDWIRGVRGSFSHALHAVYNLAGVGIAPQIIMTLMQINRNDIKRMVSLAQQAGAESVKFNIVQPAGRGTALKDGLQGLEIGELIELGREVETRLAPQTKVRLFFDHPPAFRSLKRITGQDGCGVCGILGILGVLPDGHYALCGIGQHIPGLVFGAVGKDSLKDIWEHNEVLTKLRSGLPAGLSGVCSECLMQPSCLGSCVAQNYNRTGSLWGSYWFCEEAFKRGLFPDSRLKCMTPTHAV